MSKPTTTPIETKPILPNDSLSSWINTPLAELAGRTAVAGYADASQSPTPITWADICEKVVANMALIQQGSGLPTIAIQQSKADDLLAALIAVWRAGKVAVLSSAKTFPAPVKPLSTASSSAAFEDIFGEIELPEKAAELQLDSGPNQTALLIFTSGSSGKPTGIVKSFNQLDAEVSLLEHHWGSTLDSSVFVSMVSRHHMFGLPFGLLWPALRGSAVFTKTVDYSESLETLANAFAITLIASPVQLDKMPASLNWQRLKNRIQGIFSAGAPLPTQAAQHCEAQGLTVTEIYGSTETGAVAWRQQLKSQLWQCLQGIRVEIEPSEQTLKINSPCLPKSATTAHSWFTSADKAEIKSPEQFELLGRADRICKIGAKRISLNQIELGLENHPWVKQARCLLLEEKHSRIAAVLVLNAEGQAALIDQGRLAIKQQLSQHLKSDIDAIALPRYWRYLSAIPVDTQGKYATNLLSSLFHPEQQPRLPVVLEQTQTADNTIELRLEIQHNLAYFNGHFPGNPVLPGVVQIAWVQHYTKQLFEQLSNGVISGTTPTVLRLEVLKFQHIIQPTNPVTLKLVWLADKSKLQFSYRSGSTNYSSGRVVYTNTQAEA